MHKKYLFGILSLIFAGATAFGSFGAYALRVKGAGSTGFGFGGTTQTKSFYLTGSFNGWNEADSDYAFTDVTSEMSPETNKIAEYKITGVQLSKNQTLKIVDSESVWYGGNGLFEDRWNVANTDKSGNYVVPMSSNNYTICLKVYMDCYSICLDGKKNILRFEAATNHWFSADAIVKINIKSSNSGNAKDNPGDVTITGTKDSGTTNKYVFELSNEQYENVLFGSGTSYYAYLRCSPSGDVWNYSSWMQISNSDTNNAFWLYDSSSWDNWGPSNGSWWTI